MVQIPRILPLTANPAWHPPLTSVATRDRLLILQLYKILPVKLHLIFPKRSPPNVLCPEIPLSTKWLWQPLVKWWLLTSLILTSSVTIPMSVPPLKLSLASPPQSLPLAWLPWLRHYIVSVPVSAHRDRKVKVLSLLPPKEQLIAKYPLT